MQLAGIVLSYYGRWKLPEVHQVSSNISGASPASAPGDILLSCEQENSK